MAKKPKHALKDSVFKNLFGDKKYLLRLYKSLHPEDSGVTEDDIKDVTIRPVFMKGNFCRGVNCDRQLTSRQGPRKMLLGTRENAFCFRGKRKSSGANEIVCLHAIELCGACDDEGEEQPTTRRALRFSVKRS